jgi:iron complex outermembrane recepter protein
MGGIVLAGQGKLKGARTRLWAAMAAILFCTGAAAAQSAPITIPEQPLSQALREIGRQTGQNILFTPDSVAGLRAHALRGQMTARQAVDDLLQGTGLVAVADGNRGLLVERPVAPLEAPRPPEIRAAAPADALPSEQVIVSSTRITNIGFNAPTPITVVSADMIAKSAQSSVFDTVTQLPALEGSTGPEVNTNATSTGLNGLSSFGLRGLGTIRTLVLLDGQRVAPANVTGTADINEFPQLLIQRIDVVTGGASASWGSDAVAGVINFITDKDFVGLKANILGGITAYGDDANVTAQIAGGTRFAGGRGHVEISGEYSNTAGVHPTPGLNGYGLGPGTGIDGRDWNVGPGIQMLSIAATPPGLPQYTYGAFAQSIQAAKYGLITAGPLQGIAFGAGGVPFNFQYGSGGVPTRTASGAVTGCVNPICFGGDIGAAGSNGTSIADTLVRGDVYARISYDFSPSLSIWATANLGSVHSVNTPNSVVAKTANLIIQCGNPFLPSSIVTACATNGIDGFQYGTANGEFPEFITVHVLRDQRRFVLGADGALNLLGSDWTWNSYFQHGENNTSIRVRDISLNPRYNQAIDATRDAAGNIVCRSALAQASGCAALNIMGNVAPDPAAIAYVIPPNGPYQLSEERQEVFSATVNGSPFSDWAGLVSIASGVEYREEAYRVTGDPYGNGITADDPNTAAYPADPILSAGGNNWYAGNFHNAGGNYHVAEGFLEAAIPLADSTTFGRADLNLAGRITGYSTSGQVSTWKVGAVWDTPLNGVRLRALQSRDVRAPNLSELFAANINTNGTVINDFTGNNVTVLNVATGNTQLQPERARTTNVGVVLLPAWLPGFNFSIDYYRIAVKGEIASLTPQQEVDLCFGGNQAVCSQAIVTTTGGPPQFSPFSQVIVKMLNLASVVTDGFDVEANYKFSLQDWGIAGDVTLRALLNHTSKFITDSGITGQPIAESAGNMTLGAATAGNVPLWKGFFTQDYANDSWGFTVTERWVSDGVFNKMYIECTAACPSPTVAHPTINFNQQAGALYFDIGGSFALDKQAKAYFKIDNVANVSPPPSPAIGAQNYGVNPAYYDVIGRMYRIGVRLNFD